MSEEDSTRLWFLLRNPRALGEVEDWLKEKRQEYEDNYNSPISEAADRIKIITIDELLADIQKQFDLNFPPTNNSKETTGAKP